MTKGRVLVTGRYGFTGHYVANALSNEGWEVWSLGTQTPEKPSPFDRIADLTDAESIDRVIKEIKPNAVIHLAGIAFVAHGSADDFYKVNLMGTRNLLSALAKEGHGEQGIVLASSANVYGNSRINPISESALPAPNSDYAVSKLAMENVSRLFAGDLPIVIARPFNYTGVGQDSKFLVPKIVLHFRDRVPRIELGNLDVARDFSDVRDVARVYSALLTVKHARNEIVNICSGRAISLGKIIEMCRSLTGHDLEVVVNPAFVRSGEIKTLNGDPSHLEKLVGGLKRHRFEDTLQWMLEA